MAAAPPTYADMRTLQDDLLREQKKANELQQALAEFRGGLTMLAGSTMTTLVYGVEDYKRYRDDILHLCEGPAIGLDHTLAIDPGDATRPTQGFS